MKGKRVACLLRVATGGLFAFSGWSKLTRPVQEFQYAMEQYQLFSALATRIISEFLPWFELVLGTFLILGFLRKISAVLLSLLNIGFLTVLISALIRGIDVANCGCFGESIHLTLPQAVAFDSGLLAALLFLTLCRENSFELDAWIQKKSL